jgi:pyruvate dehydrogenase E2 component (dihydrolipoamide acetyltransferase)
MRSGVLVRWLKADGDSVKPGDSLFEVETDKAVTEVLAEAGGILRRMDYKEGDEIPIGTLIAYLLAEGERLPDAVHAPARPETPGHPDQGAAGSYPAGRPARERIIATPIARRMAREKGIDLSQVPGTGPGGRVIEADLLAYLRQTPAESPPAVPSPGEAPYERVPLSKSQIFSGQRMALSAQTIPQFVLEVDADMSEAQRLRRQAQERGEKPGSYTALLVRVAAEALVLHPQVNASLDGEFVRRYQEINVGVAVAARQGLIVPVVRRANTLRLGQIQALLDEVRAQLTGGKIDPLYLSGGTFTLSNLGMYGIDRFQAIVNPPEAAILAAGRIRELPWVGTEGLHMRTFLTLRLSVDHRILDGAAAAPFLVEVKRLLEDPYRLL